MTPLAILPILAFITIVIVWSYVLGQRKRDAVNHAFLLLAGLAGGWLGIHLLFYIPNIWGVHEWLYIIQAFFWIPVGLAFLNFTYALVERKRDLFFKIGFWVTILCIALHLRPAIFIAEYRQVSWGIIQIYDTSLGVGLYALVAGVTAFYAAAGIYLVYAKRRRTTNPNERKTLGIILYSGMLTIAASFTANIIIPISLGLSEYPKYGSSMTVIFIGMVFLAVNKYQFLSMSVESVANELFDDINDGVLLIGSDDIVHRENNAIQKMLGSGAVGRKIESVLPGIDFGTNIVNETATVETVHGRRVLAVSSSSSTRSGVRVGKIVIVRDITAQKEAEEVLQRSRDDLERVVEIRTAELRHAQRMEAIGTFTGAIAHDFNNLLSAILGFASSAQKDVQKKNPAYNDLREIVTAGRRAKEIILKLLTFSRPDEYMAIETVSVKEVLREIVELVSVSLPSNIETRYDIDACDASVRCDPAQLTQLIMNLSANAFYALREVENGKFSIRIDRQVIDGTPPPSTPTLLRGEYVRIEVRDNGQGMSPETKERIFDPFFTTKAKGEGTGLGLSSSLGIVRSHGGAISVDSALHKGTTFTIYLPTTAEKVTKPLAITDVDVEGGTERLLVVDDEPQLIRLMARQLEPLGYRVTLQSSSRKAFQLIHDNPGKFDLVLSDYTMPELTGIQLAEEALRIAKDLPIIIMSGYGEALTRKKLDAVGIRALLRKPIPLIELTRTIRSVLDTESAESSAR